MARRSGRIDPVCRYCGVLVTYFGEICPGCQEEETEQACSDLQADKELAQQLRDWLADK